MSWLTRRRVERQLRELGRSTAPAPPRDLAERIKAEIPADLTLAGLDGLEEESPEPTLRMPTRWQPHRWRLAAALVMTVATGSVVWWVGRERGVPVPAAVSDGKERAKTDVAEIAPPADDERRRDRQEVAELLRRELPAARAPAPEVPVPTPAAPVTAPAAPLREPSAPDRDADRGAARDAGQERSFVGGRLVPKPPPIAEPEGGETAPERELQFNEEVQVSATRPASPAAGSAAGGTAASGESVAAPPPGPGREAQADQPERLRKLSARAAPVPPAEVPAPKLMQEQDLASGMVGGTVPDQLARGAVEFARGHLEAGRLPPAGAVRVEDFLAAFVHGGRPAAGSPSIIAAGGPPPVAAGDRSRLMTLDLRSTEVATMQVEVRFDPAVVARARRLGAVSYFATTKGAKGDGARDERSLSTAELAHGVTLLYELELTAAPAAGPLVTVDVRYRPAGGPETPLSRTVRLADLAASWDASPATFRRAAVAGALGAALADPTRAPDLPTLSRLATHLATTDYPGDPTVTDLAHLAALAAAAR